jgi:hypothetical protein
MNMNNATPLPTDRRALLRGIIAGAAGAATTLPATVASASAVLPAMAPAATVAMLIEKHRVAYPRWLNACDLTDEIRAEEEGREVTVEDEAEHDAASFAEDDALLALCAYRPATMEEVRERGMYLAKFSKELSPEQFEALFASYA